MRKRITYYSQEWLLDSIRQIVHHIDGLDSQRQIGSCLSLVMLQLSFSILLLLPRLTVPLVLVILVLVHLMNSLQRHQCLVQQKGSVIHQHINELDKVVSILGFINDSILLHCVRPEGLEDNTDVIANCELVIKFTSSASRLNFSVETHQSSDKVILRQRVADNFCVKGLHVTIHYGTGEENHLNELGCQVWVADVVRRTNDGDNESDQIAHAQVVVHRDSRCLQHLRTVLNDKEVKISNVFDVPVKDKCVSVPCTRLTADYQHTIPDSRQRWAESAPQAEVRWQDASRS